MARPAERGIAPLVAAPAMPAPVDPSIEAQVAAIVARAQLGDGNFSRTLAASQNVVANGRNAQRGSEAWIAAQTARSALEAARQPAMEALADLDQLRLTAVTSGKSDAKVAEAQAQVQAIITRQGSI